MNYHIAVIPGDGIGPEIVAEAKKVLNKVADTYGHTFEYEELLMGGCSIDAYGEPLTDETLERAHHRGAHRRQRRARRGTRGQGHRQEPGGRSFENS